MNPSLNMEIWKYYILVNRKILTDLAELSEQDKTSVIIHVALNIIFIILTHTTDLYFSFIICAITRTVNWPRWYWVMSTKNGRLLRVGQTNTQTHKQTHIWACMYILTYWYNHLPPLGLGDWPLDDLLDHSFFLLVWAASTQLACKQFE